MSLKHSLPADIERASMSVISRELNQRGIILPEGYSDLVKRVIHTTADFDYAQTLRFTSGASELASAALRNGTAIITDTNMAKAGISKPALAKLGGQVLCFMADSDVAHRAAEDGTTRAAAAMKKAAQQYPGAAFAIGNAPTALFCIAKLIGEGLRPAFVIGAPVGFVNVVESKEAAFAACTEHNVPAIFFMGRKGGSGVAAAVCNALLYQNVSRP